MRNKLGDVRNHMVAMMDALADETATPEEMARHIDRAKAMALVGGVYIAAVRTELDAFKAFDETNLLTGAVDPPGMRVIDGGKADGKGNR